MFYKLVDHKPVRCASGQVWAQWYEAACQSGERVVARDEIGPFEVSTIFTGLDPNPVDARPPQLFETMVFADGRSTGVTIRSATWEQAQQAHRVRVRDAEEGNADDDDHQ